MTIERKRRLKKEEVINLFEQLLKDFGIDQKGYKINIHKGMLTHQFETEIKWGLKGWKDSAIGNQTDVFMHEFAHLIDFDRNGHRKKPNGRGWFKHDEVFYEILKEILTLKYENIKEYEWKNDYVKIYKCYIKEFFPYYKGKKIKNRKAKLIRTKR
jgi:predicted SprT family Zn-dependent metalloprotease